MKRKKVSEFELDQSNVMDFFGYDEPEDIAGYMASLLNSVLSGQRTIEDLCKEIKESDTKEFE